MFTNETPVEVMTEDAIIKAYERLDEMEPGSDEYNTLVTTIKTLSEVKSENSEAGLSVDTAVTVGANLAGILLILHHERAHVIATKAYTLVRKLW